MLIEISKEIKNKKIRVSEASMIAKKMIDLRLKVLNNYIPPVLQDNKTIEDELVIVDAFEDMEEIANIYVMMVKQIVEEVNFDQIGGLHPVLHYLLYREEQDPYKLGNMKIFYLGLQNRFNKGVKEWKKMKIITDKFSMVNQECLERVQKLGDRFYGEQDKRKEEEEHLWKKEIDFWSVLDKIKKEQWRYKEVLGTEEKNEILFISKGGEILERVVCE